MASKFHYNKCWKDAEFFDRKLMESKNNKGTEI